ncbi:Aminotransferase-like, plant mobile domain [Sesbania bispinosa]|nr:Aminotransferase-like, plant mobile domain [Sesbania bispinosa]
MVKLRLPSSERSLEGSSTSESDNEIPSPELIPRSISFDTWAYLPSARVTPTDSSHRKWADDREPPLRPFLPAPPSGDVFFKDSLISSVVHPEEALLFFDIPNIQTHSVGPSLLRSRVRREEFPWSAIVYASRSTATGCWSEWVDHVFANDPPFVDILTRTGVVDAIKLSTRLGTYRRLEDLDFLVQRCHLIDMAKELKVATVNSAKYSREFLAKRRAAPLPPADPSTKTPPRKVRGTGNVLPPELRKNARDSVKYTYATWVRYFFGDYAVNKSFLPGPPLPQSLKRAAFLAFWLSKYVFLGPPWESVSPSVFILACVLAEGIRLPLAPLFLGGFCGRLDQIQDQMFTSFGRFPINSFVDLVFLQFFLYERFPENAPVRTILEPPQGEEGRPVEPRAWGWFMGRPRQSLSELLDEEDQFIHRPYTSNFFPGVESLHPLYQQSAFSSRNIKASRSEGVFDLWQLILQPQPLPGFIITDTVSAVGGALWPFSYRPDRVCRQFGLDQPPCCLKLEFCDVGQAMQTVLFKSVDDLSEFDPAKFISPDRAGRVLDVWVAYFHRLKTSVKRYEGQASMQVFPNIRVMHKDPYFVTSSRGLERTVSEGTQIRKRKLPSSQSSKGRSKSLEDDAPLAKKVICNSTPISAKKPQTRSPKVKKKPVAPSWASARLKAKPLQKVCDQVVKDSPSPFTNSRAATQSSSATSSSHDSTQSCGGTLEGIESSPKNHAASICSSKGAPSNVPSPVLAASSDHVVVQKDLHITEESSVIVPASPMETVPVLASLLSEDDARLLSDFVPASPMETVPVLASLLSEDDARLLSDFSSRNDGFLLSEDFFPSAFMKPAYSLFADFLRFVRSQPLVDLLHSHKARISSDLKALSLFGFKGIWFDALCRCFDQPIPPLALENLDEICNAIIVQDQKNVDLRAEIDRLRAELFHGETKLKELIVKRKEVEDARAILAIPPQF